MNEKIQVKNCRPFTMMHNDFLDYEGLNSKEKLVMIMLMRYDGIAFPSIPKLSKKIGLSERTVRYAIKSLEEKNFISRQARYTADGGRLSNAYIITDDPSIWKSETSDELSEEMSKQELEEMAEMLRLAGYSVQGPSEQNTMVETPITDSTESSIDDSTDDSIRTLNDDPSDTLSEVFADALPEDSDDIESDIEQNVFTSDTVISEDHLESSKKINDSSLNFHSMDYLYQYFNYNLIRSFKNPYGGLNFRENKHDQELLDTVFSVLYDMLNDPSAYILIGQESVSRADVKKALLSLTFDAIIGVIDTYNKLDQQENISDPISWFRQALYKGNETHIFDG